MRVSLGPNDSCPFSRNSEIEEVVVGTKGRKRNQFKKIVVDGFPHKKNKMFALITFSNM